MRASIAGWLRRVADRVDPLPPGVARAFTFSPSIQNALDVLYGYGWRWKKGAGVLPKDWEALVEHGPDAALVSKGIITQPARTFNLSDPPREPRDFG